MKEFFFNERIDIYNGDEKVTKDLDACDKNNAHS